MNSFSKSSPAIFCFGPFELRPQARELYKHGIKVRLRPQPFKVLHFLLNHAGSAVTREELHQELWPSDTFVDFQHGLNTTAKELRRALGDFATDPRCDENCKPVAHLPELVAHANAISKSLDGRSVFDDRLKKPPVPAKRQLSLF